MVAHGRNGWALVDFDCDEKTGVRKLTYERERTDTLEIETRVVIKHPNGREEVRKGSDPR